MKNEDEFNLNVVYDGGSPNKDFDDRIRKTVLGRFIGSGSTGCQRDLSFGPMSRAVGEANADRVKKLAFVSDVRLWKRPVPTFGPCDNQLDNTGATP